MYSDIEEIYSQLQKEMERQAINTLVQVKLQQVQEIKQKLQTKLDALAATMYHSTQSDLPADLKGALTGKASDAAQHFLKDIQKLKLITPVKGG